MAQVWQECPRMVSRIIYIFRERRSSINQRCMLDDPHPPLSYSKTLIETTSLGQLKELIHQYHLESRWRNSHVLVHHGPYKSNRHQFCELCHPWSLLQARLAVGPRVLPQALLQCIALLRAPSRTNEQRIDRIPWVEKKTHHFPMVPFKYPDESLHMFFSIFHGWGCSPDLFWKVKWQGS